MSDIEYKEMPKPPVPSKIVTVEKSRKDELPQLLKETQEGERRDLRKDKGRDLSRRPGETAQRETPEQTLERAESYKTAYGSEITWGEETYDLGTTAGWKKYNQAVREAKSGLSEYRRQQRQYEIAQIRSRTPEPYTTVQRPYFQEVGPPKPATERDIMRLTEAGYELPRDEKIYISPRGEPFYYEEPTLKEVQPPEPPSNILYKTEAFFRKAFEKGYTAKTQLRAGAEAAKLAGRDLEAGAKFSAAYGVLALTSFGEGATFPIRPYAWYGAAQSVRQIVTSPEARAQVVQSIKADPLSPLVAAPSAYLGGLTTAKIIQTIRGPKITTTIKERYQPSRIGIRGKYGGVPRSSSRDYKLTYVPEDVQVVQRGTVPGLTERQIYSAGEVSKGRAALGLGEGKYPSTGFDKKLWGYAETGEGLVPIQIPKGMGETRTIYRLSAKKIYQATRIPKIHSLDFGLNKFKVITKVMPRTSPAAAGVLGLVPTVKTVQVQTPQQVLKSRQQLTQRQVSQQNQIQRQVQPQLQVSSQIQRQEQELQQKQLQKQIQKQNTVQTQIQRQILKTPKTPTFRTPPVPSMTPMPITPILPPRIVKKRKTRDPWLGLDVWGEPRTYAKSLEPVISKKLKKLVGL